MSGRIEEIDFLRGFVILEMIFSHYSRYCPQLVGDLISYLDTGMPLFMLLAGFMVGQHYFPAFVRNGRKTARRLWGRALQILLIQYLIIATVNTPLHVFGYENVGRNEPLWLFLLKSAAFLNQVGIVHILPTFIPMFLASPLILLLFKKRLDWLLCLMSAALFAVGHFSPHLLDPGEPAIFPAIVMQIYFVAGSVWGKSVRLRGSLGPRALSAWLIASCAALLTTMTLIHGKLIPAVLVSTHPLNLFGLLYQVPIMTTLILCTIRFSRAIRRMLIYPWMTLLGRHALLAFVIHIYWAKAMLALNIDTPVPAPANYALIFANLGFVILVLRRYENRDGKHPARWVRALDVVFK